MASTGGKVPEVSIDEALRLFLAIACPGGVPAEAEEALVAVVKQRVAEDRPAWAHASGEPVGGPSPHAPGQPAPAAPAPYSQIKAQAVQSAQAEDVPGDPEERYFHDRKQEAMARVAERRSEEREAAARERLARERLAGAAGRTLRVAAPEHRSDESRVLAPGRPSMLAPARKPRRREQRPRRAPEPRRPVRHSKRVALRTDDATLAVPERSTRGLEVTAHAPGVAAHAPGLAVDESRDSGPSKRRNGLEVE